MKVSRSLRAFSSIATVLFLLAGLPSLALASGSDARPATAGPTISGTVTALIGGAPLAGIQVAVVGESDGTVVTGADGTYVLPVVGSDTYEVMFTDPALKYVQACYDTDDWGNANIGCNQWTDVPVSTDPVDGFDVQLMEGEHITGTVTGPATPANNLAGVQVQANDPSNYTSYAKTAADGTYSLTVPAGDFSVTFNLAPYYARACYWDGTTLASSDDRCTGAVTVEFSDVSGINAQLGFGDGTTIAVTPDGSTIAAGTSATFVATLNAVKN
jgi:hypothetical protein